MVKMTTVTDAQNLHGTAVYVRCHTHGEGGEREGVSHCKFVHGAPVLIVQQL